MPRNNYHQEFGSFPPPFTRSPGGKRLHSWRTLILPYLDQQSLYDSLRLNEPWNSPHNCDIAARFGDKARWVYQCPIHPKSGSDGWTDTCYVAIVGARSIWQFDEPLSYHDVVDGTSNTVSVIEIANSEIHWMEPYDREILQMFPKIRFVRGQSTSSYHGSDGWGAPTGGSFIGKADGAVRFLPETLPDDLLKQLVTVDDGLPEEGWGDRLDRSR